MRHPPWNANERAALAACGVALADPSALLRVEAQAWRRVVLAARERVVLVIPASVRGEPKAPHPLTTRSLRALVWARLASLSSRVPREA